MQARLLFAACAAVCCITGGAIYSQRHQPSLAILNKKNLNQDWSLWGSSRGKLVLLLPGMPRTEITPQNTVENPGLGSNDDITVVMPSALVRLLPEGTLSNFSLRHGESYEVRDRFGRLLVTAWYLPFTPEEDRRLREEAAQREQQQRRNLYDRPTTFSPSGTRVSHQNTRLVTWIMDSMTDDQGAMIWDMQHNPIPLHTEGYAWKVRGDVKVTMSLYTDPKYQPLVRHFQSTPPFSHDRKAQPYWPKAGAQPRIFWSQSARAATPAKPNFFDNYELDENGGWKSVARSGEFTGYGKHVISGPDGKPQLILEVTPR